MLRLHLHTVMIKGLRVSLLSEPLEQLADRVVFRNGESHLVSLALLLSLHISNLSEDDLQEGESVHEDGDVGYTHFK